MIFKNKISTVFRQTFYYALKVWLVDILIFIVILCLIFNLTLTEFCAIAKFFRVIALGSLLFLILFSWISYQIVAFIRWNHWVKKILLSCIALIFIFISTFTIFRGAEFYGYSLYFNFSVLWGFPTLIGVGLFFPDKLDESLKILKNTEGVK